MKRSILAITRLPTGESLIPGNTMRAASSMLHAAFIGDAAILVPYQTVSSSCVRLRKGSRLLNDLFMEVAVHWRVSISEVWRCLTSKQPKRSRCCSGHPRRVKTR